MSTTDRILELLDNSLQDSTEWGMSFDTTSCARCQAVPPTDGDLCGNCRAFLLGDTDVDPIEADRVHTFTATAYIAQSRSGRCFAAVTVRHAPAPGADLATLAEFVVLAEADPRSVRAFREDFSHLAEEFEWRPPMYDFYRLGDASGAS